MYRHIDVDAVLESLYKNETYSDTELQEKFSKIANIIKLKSPESYELLSPVTSSGFRCYPYINKVGLKKSNSIFIMNLRNKDPIEEMIEKKKIEVDKDRYILCIPDSFVNFTLCEKFKNIHTDTKKRFLFENELDADHILNQNQKNYLFMRTLSEANILGTIYLYNVEKRWFVPILSNEEGSIYGLKGVIDSDTLQDNDVCFNTRDTKIVKDPSLIRHGGTESFGHSELAHFDCSLKSISIGTILQGVYEKQSFTASGRKGKDRSLENIKTVILGNMYD